MPRPRFRTSAYGPGLQHEAVRGEALFLGWVKLSFKGKEFSKTLWQMNLNDEWIAKWALRHEPTSHGSHCRVHISFHSNLTITASSLAKKAGIQECLVALLLSHTFQVFSCLNILWENGRLSEIEIEILDNPGFVLDDSSVADLLRFLCQ